MPRLLKRILKIISVAVAAIITAGIIFIYTRPVRISPNQPAKNNPRRVERLLAAKKVIFIGAHPDDIEFYCGGLVQMFRRRGADVLFAIATRGGKGRNGRAKKRLESRRSHDQLRSAKILGGVRVVLYDYPDKGMPEHIDDFARDLIKLIREEKPDLVLTWDPDFLYNPHPDHVAASHSARKALGETGAKWCAYGTWNPNLWVGYGEDLFKVKVKSLRAHTTETPWYFWPLGNRFLYKKSAGEGRKIGAHYAEVYRCEK